MWPWSRPGGLGGTARPAETEQTLRTAALLGGKFTVADLAVLLRWPAWDLAAGL
jgi:hypothetical protein